MEIISEAQKLSDRLDRLEEKIQKDKRLKVLCMIIWGVVWAAMFLAIVIKMEEVHKWIRSKQS